MEILKADIILNSLKYMNNELATQIKYVFEAEQYEILLEDIIYINKAYQNKQLKNLIKFFDKLIVNNDLTKILINKDNFNNEYREFIQYLEIWFKKHLNNGFSTFLFNLDAPINKTNNLIDFIAEANKKTQLNEEQFNNFREIINASLENKEKIKTLLSYKKTLHLSHFFMLIDNYVRSIHTSEKIEKIVISEDKNLLGKSKRGIYRTSIENFIFLLNKENINSIQKSPFHNTIEQYVKGISYTGENNKEKENNSHFIQSAYLERIFESKDIDYNGYKIKASKYSKINPYCKTLFYGTSLPIDSIEKRLKVVEVKFTKYLDELEQSVFQRNIFEKKSFYGLDVPFHIENKIIFLLNYIRTPSFVEDLYFSYLKFLKNNEEKIMNLEPLELAKGITNNLNHLEFRKFFKIWQLACIEEIILNLEKRIVNIDSERILCNVIEKCSYRYSKSMEFKPNVDFLILVFNKIGEFLQNYYSVGISTFTINNFSDNFFIMKTKDNLELFEDNKEVQIAYFPINKNKILYFINIDKNQDTSFIKKFFESVDKDNIMINKRNIFTVTIEK